MNLIEEIYWLPAGKTQLVQAGPARYEVHDYGAGGRLESAFFPVLDDARGYYVDLLFDIRAAGCEPVESGL